MNYKKCNQKDCIHKDKPQPINNFWKNNQNPDTFKYCCNDCSIKYSLKWDKEHPKARKDIGKIANKKWYKKNYELSKEKINKRRRKNREKNKEEINRKRRIKYKQNKGTIMYYFTNETNKTTYTKEFKNDKELSDWVKNNLDMSLKWSFADVIDANKIKKEIENLENKKGK